MTVNYQVPNYLLSSTRGWELTINGLMATEGRCFCLPEYSHGQKSCQMFRIPFRTWAQYHTQALID